MLLPSPRDRKSAVDTDYIGFFVGLYFTHLAKAFNFIFIMR